MKRIELTQGRFAIVDDEDFEELSRYKWYFSNGYAVRKSCVGSTRKERQRRVWMHREIMKTPADRQTDHINHNGVDNRKKNLRICTQSENQRNKTQKPGVSGLRGVYKNKNKWQARICVNNIMVNIGTFQDKNDAAFAYNIEAKKYHGEFSFENKY